MHFRTPPCKRFFSKTFNTAAQQLNDILIQIWHILCFSKISPSLVVFKDHLLLMSTQFFKFEPLTCKRLQLTNGKYWLTWYSFQAHFFSKRQWKYDIEAGMRPVSKENESLMIKKFSRFLLKFTMAFMVATVFIAYLKVISRNSNLTDGYQDFDVGYVTDSPLLGNF